MSDIKRTHFFEEVTAILEEIEAMYSDAEFEVDEEYLDEDSDSYASDNALLRFINHVRDAKQIAEKEQ